MTAYKHLLRLGLAGKRPTWTVKMATEAVALYASGLSAVETREELLRRHNGNAPSIEWIRVHVRRAGVQRSRSRGAELKSAKRFGKDYELIRRRARFLAEEKLWSVLRIAKHLGVGTRTVERALPPEHRLGYQEAAIRRCWQSDTPEVNARREKADRVVALRMEGKTYREITELTGVTRSSIGYWLRQFGLVQDYSNRKRAA